MKTILPTTQLMSCNEVEIHYKRPLFKSMPYVKSSKDADKVFRSYIDFNRIDYKEFFWIMTLTNSNQVLSLSEIGSGTIKGVYTNLPEIMQLALLTNAAGILVAHNHCSGNTKPSESDKNVTQKLSKITDLFDIRLLDHLILTSDQGYFSFSDNHLL